MRISDWSSDVCSSDLIGPNGAGKTTFFNMISGFYRPTRGRIVCDGADVTDVQPQNRVAMGMARTFQITEVFRELTVRENLRVAVEVTQGLRLKLFRSRQQARETEDRIDELLDMGGLTDKAERHVGELSHGDQRSAEIMMALALTPKLLLLDEPAADRKSTRLTPVTNAHLVCRLPLEKNT